MRLDELIEAEGDGVTIEWRSFLLRPGPEPRTREQFVEYTKKWARPADMEPRAPFTTPWASEEQPPSHSVPSAVAGKVAATFGADAEHRFHRELMSAYFHQNRDVSDETVIFDVAGRSGLNTDRFAATYRDQWQPLARAVFDDHNDAINSGVTGVPAVVVDNRYLITGAVEVDHYRRALEQVRSERSS